MLRWKFPGHMTKLTLLSDHRSVLKLTSQLFRALGVGGVGGCSQTSVVISGSPHSAHMTVSCNPTAADWGRHPAHWSYNGFAPGLPEQRNPRNGPADQHVTLLYNSDIFFFLFSFSQVSHSCDPPGRGGGVLRFTCNSTQEVKEFQNLRKPLRDMIEITL